MNGNVPVAWKQVANLTVWSEVDAGAEVELTVPAATAYMGNGTRSWFSRTLAGTGGSSSDVVLPSKSRTNTPDMGSGSITAYTSLILGRPVEFRGVHDSTGTHAG
ncbi:MAG: hypothetical protein WB679_20295 [Terracidiphilus sp.]